MKKNSQIKSKSRVNKYGEVFTNEREVNKMLDLVDQSSFVTETVLEPACGTGNFLVEALNRKLNYLNGKKTYSSLNYTRNLLLILSTLYGVDIQADNVKETRARLLEMVLSSYRNRYHSDSPVLSNAGRFIVNHNIMVGNTLSLKDNKGKALKFAEWKLRDNTFFRRDYTLEEIIKNNGECNDGNRKTYKYDWLKGNNNHDREQTDQVQRTGCRARGSLYQRAGSQCNAQSCKTRDRAY